MSLIWDHKLWDTFNPQLYNFTKYNQDFLKQYNDFLERRGRIEEKYARDLKKLCKEFKPKEFDKKEKFKFSLQSAFDDMQNELVSSANQHETLRDDLLKSSKEVKDTLKDMQRQSQQTEKKIASLVKELDRSRSQLESVRQLYQRAFAEQRKARDDYNANKDNKDITKNEEERFRQVYNQKQTQFEDRKNGYAKELTDFNTAQQSYYMQLLPEQLATLEDHEKRLAAFCHQHFLAWGESELRALDIRTKCARTLHEKANAVNADADIREFFRVTASGNPVPADVPFEDLGSNDSLGQQPRPPGGKKPNISTLHRNDRKFAPAQQKRRLEEQLKAKDDELDKANKGMDAMQKMLQTFQQNPKLGDVDKVQQQMQQANEQIAQLNRERDEILRELQALGVEIANLGGPPAVSAAPAPQLQPIQPGTPSVRKTGDASAFDDEFADESPVSPQRPPGPVVGGPPAVPPAPAVAAPPLYARVLRHHEAAVGEAAGASHRGR